MNWITRNWNWVFKRDHVCPWWLAFSFDNRLRQLFLPPLPVITPYVKPGMRCLDVGCGMGVFSLPLARCVGEGGKVYAVDVQHKMLEVLDRRAVRSGLENRIETRTVGRDDNWDIPTVDFALAFWMAHEVPDFNAFFRNVCRTLVSKGRFLMAEPLFHVSKKLFNDELDAAQDAGFELVERPKVLYSRAAVFVRP